MNNNLPALTRVRDISEFTRQLKADASRISERLKTNIQKAQAKQKTYYDKFVKANATYKIGDYVKINNPTKETGISKAFITKFNGPYIITKILNCRVKLRVTSPK